MWHPYPGGKLQLRVATVVLHLLPMDPKWWCISQKNPKDLPAMVPIRSVRCTGQPFISDDSQLVIWFVYYM